MAIDRLLLLLLLFMFPPRLIDSCVCRIGVGLRRGDEDVLEELMCRGVPDVSRKARARKV